MSLTLKDLRVIESYHDTGHAYTRSATLADLVEVLKADPDTLTIWRCEVHKCEGDPKLSVCDYAGLRVLGGATPLSCRMVERLVLPLGDTP